MTAHRYLIANDTGSDVAFRAFTPGGRGRWTGQPARAFRWPSLESAKDALAEIAAARRTDETGHLVVIEEHATPSGDAWHLPEPKGTEPTP